MRLFQEPSTTRSDMTGYIHSRETFGTVDGPGIRYVVFMQGCPMRCAYCHNPDTWDIGKGRETTAEEIIKEYEKNREFYRSGGITISGGEPLMQIEFVTELFRKAKELGIHTCLDTSGAIFDENNPDVVKKVDMLLDVCDLVMLDIKHIDDEKHKELTGFSNRGILSFARYLEDKKIPVWIRNVVVPGVTDGVEDLIHLGEFIGSLKNLKALDVLPYHTMGVKKYEELGIKYRLEGVSALSAKELDVAKKHIMSGVKSVRGI